MNKLAKIILSNNEELIISETTQIVILSKRNRESSKDDNLAEKSFKYTTSQRYPLTPYYHIHDGFIPSLTEIFSNGDFFSITGDTLSKVYAVHSIVSISNFSN